MRSEEIIAFVGDAPNQAALYLDDVPTIGLVVAAIVLHVVTDGDETQGRSPWVKGIGVLLLAAYFVHQYMSLEPCFVGEFVSIGIRSIAVIGIYLPIAELLDAALKACNGWRLVKQQSFVWWLRDVRQERSKRREAEQRRLAEANAKEPLSDEEAFELAMQKAKNVYSRQCQIINANDELDGFERDAAIEQAKAKMTKRIHKILEREYSR